MKQVVALALCLILPTVTLAAEAGHKVKYDGGSIANIKSGTDIRVTIDQQNISLVRDRKELVAIPAASIAEISYGQDVHRRIGAAIGIGVFTLGVGALMALTKSKKHYIGLTWDDAGKKGGLAFQADKSDYRGLLAGLEGVSGKKAVNTDTMSVKN
ncbi:MAG TPA: hypothetical protein VFQ91_07725 [Bryobacteraceae bacterium]|nr:hypothetical protein [Bryobacteraceae bacterium]